MTLILERAAVADIPFETRQMMRAKIIRRVQKLNLTAAVDWCMYVRFVVEITFQQDSSIWKTYEGLPDPYQTRTRWDQLKSIKSEDTILSLHNLSPYLRSITRRDQHSKSAATPTLSKEQRVPQSHHKIPLCTLKEAGSESSARLWLMDVEAWVEKNLNAWSGIITDPDIGCTQLSELIQHYLSTAHPIYTNYPEDFSRMILTVMEIWVQLDRKANEAHPILANYTTGFKPSLLDPLLLPSCTQLARLRRIEIYIEKRDRTALPHCPSVFTQEPSTNTLAVRYYENSSPHQQLRSKIEAGARQVRELKLAELQQKQSEQKQILKETQSLQCQCLELQKKCRQTTSKHNKTRCNRCQLVSKAGKMKIDVHEWPLPSDALTMKTAIFELAVPPIIHVWREMTFIIMRDIFDATRQSNSNPPKIYYILDYAPLLPHASSMRSRFELGSTTKSFINAHYKKRKISVATAENVCVNHGMQYTYFDRQYSLPASRVLCVLNVRAACTFQLPAGSYGSLQDLISGTEHTPNEVIVLQANCDRDLTVHELEAFGELRSGENIQLYNVAYELIRSVLDVTREEVSLLVLQTMWQAGPCDTADLLVFRRTHAPLNNSSFAGDLLLAAEEALARHESNWQQSIALHTLAAVVQRVLSLCPQDEVRGRCIVLLRRMRATTLSWLQDLENAFNASEDEQQRVDISRNLLTVALTGCLTFDCDFCHQESILKDDDDLADMFQCLAMVSNYMLPSHTLSQREKRLVRRWSRLTHSFEERLRQAILSSSSSSSSSGIDRFVTRAWPDFMLVGRWKVVPTAMSWIEAISHAPGKKQSTVHFNLLHGTLLVDGDPVARLPSEIVEHPTYQRLFGAVSISTLP